MNLPSKANACLKRLGGSTRSTAKYWQDLVEDLMALLPPIDYDFEATVTVSYTSGADWVSGSDAYTLEEADPRTPFAATRS